LPGLAHGPRRRTHAPQGAAPNGRGVQQGSRGGGRGSGPLTATRNQGSQMQTRHAPGPAGGYGPGGGQGWDEYGGGYAAQPAPPPKPQQPRSNVVKNKL
jgi:hypothetical protein